MAAINFVICFSAVFIQVAYTCPTNRIGLPIPYNQANSIIDRPGCGGRFPIETLGSFTSSAPLSLSVRSENLYQGTVNVRGRLPFKGTVGLEGVVPSAGEGLVSYGLGDSLAIAEVPLAALASPVYGPGGAYGPSVANYGPGVTAYGPGVTTYGPEVVGCGRKVCNCGC